MTPATVSRSSDRSAIEQKIRFGALKGVTAWGALARQTAVRKAPVDTGRLARSIELGEAHEIEKGVIAIDLGTNVAYARAQEFGSGIHAENSAYRHYIPIQARRRKALAFEWPGGPAELRDAKTGLFFFRSVKHPGVPPHPYLRPAVEETRDTGGRLVLAAVAASLRGMG